MGAGQNLRPIAIDIERIFDDVVACRTDHMHEQLTGEGGKRKPRAYLRAVHHDGRIRCRQRFTCHRASAWPAGRRTE